MADDASDLVVTTEPAGDAGDDPNRRDSFTETTTQGFFSRLLGSVVGVAIGGVLFLLAFVVLFINEGRADGGNLARQAVEVNPGAVNAGANGKLVSVSGTLNADEAVGDTLFLRPGPYLSVVRQVESYAWVEKQNRQTKTNVGGSQTTETTYTYERQWVETPAQSSSFRQPAGHENPAKTLANAEARPKTAKVGAYTVDLTGLDLPAATPLTLTPDNTTPTQGAGLAGPTYLFLGKGSLPAPQVGDQRISYRAVNSGLNGTVFGRLAGDRIGPYTAGGDRLYRAFNGSRTEAIQQLHTEFTIATWIVRGVGFLMMWIGLAMTFGPISVFLDILPIFGSISRAAIGLITFLVALALSIVTVIASILLHHIIAILIALAVGAALIGGIVLVAHSRGARPRLRWGS